MGRHIARTMEIEPRKSIVGCDSYGFLTRSTLRLAVGNGKKLAALSGVAARCSGESELIRIRASRMRETQAETEASTKCRRLRPKRKNYQRTLSCLYKLNFSSQVTTGILSHTAWAMIWRSNGSAWCGGRSKR
jgi:hypothetical protein